MAKNLFNSIKLLKPKKNVFDLTHDVKLSCDMGNLVPILNMECVPGDKITLGCESIVRMAPMLAPVMHRMDVSIHYFFVPNRIVWDNWEKFIVDPNGNQHTFPYIYYSGGGWGPFEKFMDYMGVPPKGAGSPVNLNAIPFAAYQCIYNEYYRDQNLVSEVNYKLTDGGQANIVDLLTMRKRAWEHDYFTASLPFAQKGAAVDIPLGVISEDAPVSYNSALGGNNTDLTNSQGYGITVDAEAPSGTNADLFAETQGLEIGATTINDLRRAFRLQEWLEKNARGGTRYIENILTHFGVKSSDARLQRPEYITGIKTPIVVSEVLNTTTTFSAGNPSQATSNPAGTMAGHGISVTSGKNGAYFCEEHGYIIGIMSIMPKTAYQQGIPRTFLKNDPLDFYWPSFAHIGEQEVTKNEIYAYTPNGDQTFGYVPRYAEYKYMPSRVAGDFRTTLNYWHLGRIFANEPSLNQSFIECDPSKRIFAVSQDNQDSLYCHVLNRITAVRPMPKFGTPML